MTDTFEYPESIDPSQIDTQTSRNIDWLAENVSKPFPIEDLIKIGIAITGQQKRAEVAEAESMTDELTELPNLRYFNEQLAETISEAQRRGFTFYLAMIDFDDFKSINSSYGWDGGDAALQLIAGLTHREGEPISRVGGDEFAQIVSPHSEMELVGMADRYQAELKRKKEESFGNIVTLEGQEAVPFSISIGFARWQGETAEELRKKAGAAALEAKRLGKGTAVLSRTMSNGTTRLLEIGEQALLQQTPITQ